MTERMGRALDVAMLLTSELVTNAILYAGTEIDLVMRFEADRLRIEVVDRSADRPVPRIPPPDATSGRGLALIESLALAWGVEDLDDGKCVWFELEM